MGAGVREELQLPEAGLGGGSGPGEEGRWAQGECRAASPAHLPKPRGLSWVGNCTRAPPSLPPPRPAAGQRVRQADLVSGWPWLTRGELGTRGRWVLVFGLLRGPRTVRTEEDRDQRRKPGVDLGEALQRRQGTLTARTLAPQLPGTLRMKPERFLVKSGCGWLSRVSTETVHFFPCRLHCTGLVTLT